MKLKIDSKIINNFNCNNFLKNMELILKNPVNGSFSGNSLWKR